MMKNIFFLIMLTCFNFSGYCQWESYWVRYDVNGKLVYKSDASGNTIPDFSMVGYEGGKTAFAQASVKFILSPSGADDTKAIQQAINEVGKLPIVNQMRGAILLKKGAYTVSATLQIKQSGILIKGEGDDEKGTVINYTSMKQSDLFGIAGRDSILKQEAGKTAITDDVVPVGSKTFHVASTTGYKPGDKVIVYRPATAKWIHDIKMDSINKLPPNGRQWPLNEFNLSYERLITAVNTQTKLIALHAPLVMNLDKRYGGGQLYHYTFAARINHVAIQNLRMVSVYAGEDDEQHGWNAISIKAAEDCWVDKVTSVSFGYSCVNIAHTAKNVTVQNSRCLDPVSQIQGGRRYSFNCDGQLNLFKNCVTRNGRHDFVTGGAVCGPNVFYNCSATKTHADIGPHHRWGTGTLYDNVTTDGEINVQDRGASGTGHGWAGAFQVFWNCTAKTMICQQPPMAINWNIAPKARYGKAWHPRPNSIWEGIGQSLIKPVSLYQAQLNN
ncbi:hypothetical protein ACFQ3S_01470 [Mucilaginibacter terrae]|uniref:hypothetical protein n=1 Tax=Mucilaginibacter terrae TaxID=1955052 RepID=UPI0036257EE8